MAVKRILSSQEKTVDHEVLYAPRVVKLLEDHVQDYIRREISEASKELVKQMREQLESLLDAEDLATVKQLTKSRTIKCMMDKWLKSKEGKTTLREINMVNRSGDVLNDIKTYIESGDEEKLQEIYCAIDGVTTLPGRQGFVDLISGYMDANLIINQKPSLDELIVIQEKVAAATPMD